MLPLDHNLVDRPTMGSMWCHRQVRASYISFINFQKIQSFLTTNLCSLM
jgi:hypothetical protein